MKLLRQIGAVATKDLLVEWRSPARISGVFFFALALVLLVAFASGATGLRKLAGATLWVGLLLASTRSLDRSFAIETEHGALEGLVLWPVDALAIYYGKALANAALLLGVGVALTPLMIVLYEAPVRGSYLQFAVILVLGAAALAAPGTLLALLTSQARGASVLLPVLMFPLVMPAVLAASRGASLVIEGDPIVQAPSWIGLLVGFNAIHWSLSGLLFGRVLEDV